VEQALGPASLLAQVSTLRFPPAALTAAHFREVFNKLSAIGTFNFLVGADSVELVSPPREGGDQLKIGLTKDTVQVSFDPTSKSAEFAAEELVGIVKEIAGVLPIPIFIHQVHVLRKTMPMAGAMDARAFLMQEIVRVPPGRLAAWKRPFAAAGVRFIFPPQQMNDLSAYDLKIESFLQDPAKLFVENTASYLMPMPAGQWDVLKANLADANRFLDESAHALLRGHPAPDA
jgi:hypothetical protein